MNIDAESALIGSNKCGGIWMDLGITAAPTLDRVKLWAEQP
jgi:hypothetical protein